MSVSPFDTLSDRSGSPIANGSPWPHLPPDAQAHFLVADNYRRPAMRGKRAAESRRLRALYRSEAQA